MKPKKRTSAAVQKALEELRSWAAAGDTVTLEVPGPVGWMDYRGRVRHEAEYLCFVSNSIEVPLDAGDWKRVVVSNTVVAAHVEVHRNSSRRPTFVLSRQTRPVPKCDEAVFLQLVRWADMHTQLHVVVHEDWYGVSMTATMKRGEHGAFFLTGQSSLELGLFPDRCQLAEIDNTAECTLVTFHDALRHKMLFLAEGHFEQSGGLMKNLRARGYQPSGLIH